MKILFVIRTLSIGGATKQLVLTANALSRRGHLVNVLTYCWDKPYDGLDESINYIPSHQYSKMAEYINAVPNIQKAVKEIEPDIVISWRANAGFFSRIATWGKKCKVIYSERTDPYMETSLFLKFATWICNFSDGGVFQTEKARDYYKRLAEKSIVIPNPYDSKELLPIIPLIERKKEIAFVGRMFKVQKRQDIMLEAFLLIHKELPDYKLVFYGDGTDMAEVKSLCSKMNLDDCVTFKGAVKEVEKYIRYSRVLVLSSDYEGIPNVILESFAAGTPVVSTDCSPGGARVLIDDGLNGFIVPIRDVYSLAKQTVNIIRNNSKSNDFIIQSRNKLAEFNPKTIYDKWDQYLKKI